VRDRPTSVEVLVQLAVHLGSEGLEVEGRRDPVVHAPALAPATSKINDQSIAIEPYRGHVAKIQSVPFQTATKE
jgi:hypothetical protein